MKALGIRRQKHPITRSARPNLISTCSNAATIYLEATLSSSQPNYRKKARGDIGRTNAGVVAILKHVFACKHARHHQALNQRIRSIFRRDGVSRGTHSASSRQDNY